MSSIRYADGPHDSSANLESLYFGAPRAKDCRGQPIMIIHAPISPSVEPRHIGTGRAVHETLEILRKHLDFGFRVHLGAKILPRPGHKDTSAAFCNQHFCPLPEAMGNVFHAHLASHMHRGVTHVQRPKSFIDGQSIPWERKPFGNLEWAHQDVERTRRLYIELDSRFAWRLARFFLQSSRDANLFATYPHLSFLATESVRQREILEKCWQFGSEGRFQDAEDHLKTVFNGTRPECFVLSDRGLSPQLEYRCYFSRNLLPDTYTDYFLQHLPLHLFNIQMPSSSIEKALSTSDAKKRKEMDGRLLDQHFQVQAAMLSHKLRRLDFRSHIFMECLDNNALHLAESLHNLGPTHPLYPLSASLRIAHTKMQSHLNSAYDTVERLQFVSSARTVN